MVELVNLVEEEEFFKGALIGHVDYLAIDQQGTHIIQKIINCFSESNRQFVFDEIKDSFLKISKTSHGLCVIKKLVANTKNAENRVSLVYYISENAIELAQDPYGNYAIQEIMDRWSEQDYSLLYDRVMSRVAQLSIQKFSSNVVEKCLQSSNEEQREKIIISISKIDKLANVMKNSFGNYVVQKALSYSFGEPKESLIEAIQMSIPDIQDKKIRSKWEQILGLHSTSVSPERGSNQMMVQMNIPIDFQISENYMYSPMPAYTNQSPETDQNREYFQPIEIHSFNPHNAQPAQFYNFDGPTQFEDDDDEESKGYSQFFGIAPHDQDE